MNTLNLASNEIQNAISILKQFGNDPKAQMCLSIYHSIPEDKQGLLLIAMDAFTLGINAGMKLQESEKKMA